MGDRKLWATFETYQCPGCQKNFTVWQEVESSVSMTVEVEGEKWDENLRVM